MGNNRTATCLFTSDCATVLFLDLSVLQQTALSLDVSGLHQDKVCADPGHMYLLFQPVLPMNMSFLQQFVLSLDFSAVNQQPELSWPTEACSSPERICSTAACAMSGGVWHTAAFTVSIDMSVYVSYCTVPSCT